MNSQVEDIGGLHWQSQQEEMEESLQHSPGQIKGIELDRS
jgi:hypothetical protein